MSAQRLLKLADTLERMRTCDEGMGMHCIDLLIEEAQPLVEKLLSDYGQCQVHGYVDTSHRCAFYSGEPLRYIAREASGGDSSVPSER